MYRSVRNIPKELLQQLYVVEQWTLRDVADYFACSVDTIVRRMEEYGIERRAVKKEINRRTLVSLYREGRTSIDKLSKQFSVSPSTITNRLREYGIYCTAPSITKPIDPDRIKKAYESGNTTTAIAQMMGITRWKVLHILRHMGVSIRGQKRRIQPIEEMVYLYTCHQLSTKDIGLAYGLQSNTIALYLRESGIPMRGKTLDIDVGEIKRLRNEGFSVAAIAKIMECSTSAVRSRLRKQ